MGPLQVKLVIAATVFHREFFPCLLGRHIALRHLGSGHDVSLGHVFAGAIEKIKFPFQGTAVADVLLLLLEVKVKGKPEGLNASKTRVL